MPGGPQAVAFRKLSKALQNWKRKGHALHNEAKSNNYEGIVIVSLKISKASYEDNETISDTSVIIVLAQQR